MQVQSLLLGLCLVLLLFIESDSPAASVASRTPGHTVKGPGVTGQRDSMQPSKGPPLILTPIFVISPGKKRPLWTGRGRAPSVHLGPGSWRRGAACSSPAIQGTRSASVLCCHHIPSPPPPRTITSVGLGETPALWQHPGLVVGSFGSAAPASLAFSRHQSGLKGMVVTGVTLGHWHVQMSGQQRIFEVFQTQQPNFAGGGN